MKHISWIFFAALLLVACQSRPVPESILMPEPTASPCADALQAYAERYPSAEPQDLYKLVFQDLYGPGHLLTDSASCATYIEREVAAMEDPSAMPLYEYTLCDGRFVRVDLRLVANGVVGIGDLTSAVMRSAEGMSTPDPRFVLSHSAAFKAAYRPHYRIVRRDIFENEILPLINN